MWKQYPQASLLLEKKVGKNESLIFNYGGASMQLLSLSCVICISGKPRRYTQRVVRRERNKDYRVWCKGRERKTEKTEEYKKKKRQREHAVIGEAIWLRAQEEIGGRYWKTKRIAWNKDEK